ncbi:MAG: hypothetical protein M3R64_02305 [Pseudomonadota bacterium]|nr:hypothetical protein [Pseudomonadota bacterium]
MARGAQRLRANGADRGNVEVDSDGRAAARFDQRVEDRETMAVAAAVPAQGQDRDERLALHHAFGQVEQFLRQRIGMRDAIVRISYEDRDWRLGKTGTPRYPGIRRLRGRARGRRNPRAST